MNPDPPLPTDAQVTYRLRIASELRDLCLSLGRAQRVPPDPDVPPAAPPFAVAQRLSGGHGGGIAMTLDQLQHEAAALTADERWQLAAFLKHIERVDSPENRAELSRLNRAIDEGDCYTLEQLREMHAALEAKGL